MFFPLSNIFLKSYEPDTTNYNLPVHPYLYKYNTYSNTKFIKFYFLYDSPLNQKLNLLENFVINMYFSQYIQNKTIFKLSNPYGMKCFICLDGIDSFIFLCGKGVEINYSKNISFPCITYQDTSFYASNIVDFNPTVLLQQINLRECGIKNNVVKKMLDKKYSYRKMVFSKKIDIKFTWK